MKSPIRLVHITTVPETFIFLTGQVGEMTNRGFDVVAMSSPGAALRSFGQRERISTHAVEMPRRITPLRDLWAVGRIYRKLCRIRPHIVHAHTPKGGLLGMIAAWLAGVPVRIYHVHGLPYLTAAGLRRMLFKTTERISCALANRVLCVSPSIREVAVQDGLCPAAKIAVLGCGTINGVDATGQFDSARAAGLRGQTRRRWNIPQAAKVIGFVGRIVRDKGVIELVDAWEFLSVAYPDLHLLVVGPFEPQDPVPREVTDVLRNDPRIHLTGFQSDLPPLYASMDVVILPTYREGFPTVALETAAMALPLVATRVPGCLDGVRHGVTGTLVPPRNSQALADAIRSYLDDDGLRKRHGRAGRAWVLEDFRQDVVWDRALLRVPEAARGERSGEQRYCDIACCHALLMISVHFTQASIGSNFDRHTDDCFDSQ